MMSVLLSLPTPTCVMLGCPHVCYGQCLMSYSEHNKSLLGKLRWFENSKLAVCTYTQELRQTQNDLSSDNLSHFCLQC